MLARLARALTTRGVEETASIAARYAHFSSRCLFAVRGKRGLEIGGPSEYFRRRVPVYRVIDSLDNCVFSTDTIWEGRREDDAPFQFFRGRSGLNRVVDAVELAGIGEGEYDFVLSCHSLEHIANPVKALKNWQRVAPNCLILILPYCRESPDHRRPVTSLDHMIEDFKQNTGEDDLTHYKEVIELTDSSRLALPDGLTLDRAKELADPRDNARIRCMHHHVFDLRNATQLVNYSGYRVLVSYVIGSSIFLLASSPAKSS